MVHRKGIANVRGSQKTSHAGGGRFLPTQEQIRDKAAVRESVQDGGDLLAGDSEGIVGPGADE
jgi:hypothetical protein